MERCAIADRVRAELATLITVGPDFTDIDQLTKHGLDSLSSIQLTLNLEDSFGLFFEDDEISLTNFATVESIVNLIEFRLNV